MNEHEKVTELRRDRRMYGIAVEDLPEVDWELLRRAARELDRLGSRAAEITATTDAETYRALGRVAEAADIAGNEVFNVANTASSFLGDDGAKDAIERWRK